MTSISNLTCDRNTTFSKEVVWADANGARLMPLTH